MVKADSNECWWGCGESGTLIHDCWERKAVQLLCKTVWQFLKMLNGVPYSPAVPLLNTNPKELKHMSTSLVYSHSSIRLSKKSTQAKCPSKQEHTTEQCLTMKTMYDTCYSTGEVKDANHKRPHILWLHLCQLSTVGKPTNGKQLSGCQGLEEGLGMTAN